MNCYSAITLGAQRETVKSIEVNGFVLTKAIHPPGQALQWHSHEFASLVLLLNGSVTEKFKAMSLECGSRNLIIKPPGEAHFDKYGPSRSEELAIEVTPERLQALNPFSSVFERVSHITRGLLPTLVLRVYKEFYSMDTAAPLAIEGLLLETVAEISRHPSQAPKQKPPRWLKHSKELLHANFSEGLKLSDVAAVVGVHPVSLAREFRKFYGCTVGDYIRKLRIDFSCHALSTSSIPLFKIASTAGFSDHAHFARTFRRLTGMSPSQYRAIFRKR